jgi:hypothetical protein
MLTPSQANPAPYAFTPAEMTRLATYKAAVAAGFYTDALSPEAAHVERHQADEALDAPAAPAYPFTPAELARLAAYRLAVEAGFYSEAVRTLPTH